MHRMIPINQQQLRDIDDNYLNGWTS